MKIEEQFESKKGKLLLALAYSLIPALLINSYYAYKSFKENYEYFQINIGFFLGQVTEIFTDIGWLLYNLLNYPFLLPFPIIYVFIFFKILLSEKVFFERYKTILLTLMFIFFFVLNHYFVSKWYY